eukprot:CAMPEP_0171237172 /NCGR_PEP_ID=MMETSP0790-20130122/42834_1 /TAXON_ID=2925 /ORGANISM="Alexandrium catenella, Strain OF101" /LENGTH=468 /DNA_ID=CAMNT_0011703525 /DNA_START=47 /DNA_END=1453 /DNA_ORIENTATION=-
MAALTQNPAFAVLAPAAPVPRTFLPPESVEFNSEPVLAAAPGAGEPRSSWQSCGLFAGIAGAALAVAQRASARPKGLQKAARGAQGLTARSAFEDELGVQPPTGFWDPAGFTSDGDTFDFYRRRCVEIKHGRVSMIACIGYIVPEYFRWPGYLSPSIGIKFTDVPNGLAALTKVPAIGWQQVVFFGLAMELFAAYQNPNLPAGKLSSRLVVGLTEIKDWPNNYTFGPYGIPNAPSIADPEVRKKKLNAEIANGRLAMIAIMGMLFQNGTVGTTGPEMWLPQGAFESELGVQSPVGFWDPVGLSADGDQAAFRRRRISELKHGRISMLAAIGYIIPESYRFPGYLSPSQDLKFEDMPHGLAAISKVPVFGIAQWFIFIGFIERTFFKEDPARLPGDYANAGVLGFPDGSTISDPEEKTRRLNSELANGRLAMTAILALFFQNGTVGSTGPDMWIPPAFVKPAMMNFKFS